MQVFRRRFDQNSLSELRSAVAAHAAVLEMAPDRIADLVVVANELATNAIRYAGGAGRLVLRRQGARILCEVSDDGPGLSDPQLAGVARALPGAVGGRGLWIIRRLADDVTIDTGPTGSVVTAIFDLTAR